MPSFGDAPLPGWVINRRQLVSFGTSEAAGLPDANTRKADLGAPMSDAGGIAEVDPYSRDFSD